MIHSKGRLTDRAIRAFIHEAEKWKEDFEPTDSAMDFEEFLGLAVAAFDAVTQWDSTWHAKVNARLYEYDQAGEDRIEQLYRSWLSPSTIIEDAIARFEGSGIALSRSARYREYVEETKALLNPSDEIGGEMAIMEAEAIEEHRRGETVAWEWGH